MSLFHKVLNSTAIQFSGKLFGTLLSLFAFALLTRYLNTDGFGAFTTITAFLQFFGILADMGLSLLAIQLLAEHEKEQERYFNTLFSFRLLTATVLLALAPLAALFFPYGNEVKFGIALMALSFLFSSLSQLLTALFQRHLSMTVPFIAEVASKGLVVVGVWVGIMFRVDLFILLGVILLNNALQFALLMIASRRILRTTYAYDKKIVREIITRGWPIAASIVFNLIYFKADTIILSLFHPQSTVGLYGASYRVVEVLVTVPMMFMGLVLASFSSAWAQQDSERFRRYVQKSFDFIALLAFPLVMGTQFVARDLMTLAAGSSFTLSGDILRVLILAVGIIFFGTFFGHLINVIGQQRRMLFGYLAAAVLGFSGYIFFIPRYSYWGAAWMTVGAESIVLCMGAFFFWQKTRLLLSFAVFSKTLLASLIMAVVLFVVQPLSLLPTLLIAIGTYSTAVIAFGAVSLHQIKSLLLR